MIIWGLVVMLFPLSICLSQRLYRELYEKEKDKIHSTYDTPEIRQVKMTQKAVSDLCYKEKYIANRGTMIPMGITPQMIHCNHVNEITSDLRYKEDLLWLRGVGCFLYDTPEMVTVRNITKFRVDSLSFLSHLIMASISSQRS
uniref:Uncharacterized protein n=2 Tax=Hucho hucho TaxID=62062 RepID=A0A4W5RN88_9TELE